MWSTAREIAAGDLVIIWLTRDSVQPLVVTPGKEFNGKFGVYSHADLVGIPFGSKVGSRNGKGFVHILRPTPELWTIALPHRTQILYLADISFIISYLDIKPGSQVAEAGTGSGSFSHSVVRTIGSKGHLYSYEFHEARANKARDEFRNHGFSKIITLTHRNVCKEGFTVVDQVDSVFLDLPAPWDAIAHAKTALRKDRATRICCFSPCIEQVLRTVAALNDAGFTNLTMYETLLRPHEVHSVPPLQPINKISNKLKQQESKREYKRLKQIAASQAKKDKKRKREMHDSMGAMKNGADPQQAGLQYTADVIDSGIEAKKLRTGEEESGYDQTVTEDDLMPSDTTQDSVAPLSLAPTENPSGVTENTVSAGSSTKAVILQEPSSDLLEMLSEEPSKVVVTRVINEVRGHTSYLTFAVLLPTVLSSGNPHLLKDAIQCQTKNNSTNLHAVQSVEDEHDVLMKVEEETK